MLQVTVIALQILNQLLTAGIAITAFSLLLYALSFNLSDRVARSFALILICVVFVFVGDAIGSTATMPQTLTFWLKIEWVGIAFLPPTYFNFADALLATTGRPSRGRRAFLVRAFYLISFLFLLTLPFSLLVGPLVNNVAPAPHLQRTWLTLIFTLYYLVVMGLSGILFLRAYRRTVASVSRRRMSYLLVGALAPALGSYPYLLFGSSLAMRHPLVFWIAATISNVFVSVLLVIMAYAVAFFGVPWPDRVVKRRLFKWLMRGPVTASLVLALTTVLKRAGEQFGFSYSAMVPIVMVAFILILEHIITLAAPLWERWLFHGSDRKDIDLVQKLEERLLTAGDLRQFLEAILAAVCDRMQTPSAFIVGLQPGEPQLFMAVGDKSIFEKEDFSSKLLAEVEDNGLGKGLFIWGDYWLVPLYPEVETRESLLGLLGAYRDDEQEIDSDHKEALLVLAQRAALALEDRMVQRQVFTSLEALTPAVELIQRLRAASRYNRGVSLTQELTLDSLSEDQGKFSKWVKEALTHYWGGPKLTRNPLMRLKIVQQALQEHQDNPTNALRAILRQAIDHIRPEGERRFTGEWILYNILELKFMEGKSVREVALRLAMSEADLYRKQRVAIEAVANAIIEMEKQATVVSYEKVDASKLNN
jgi:hypothetical protein